jgi:hypothetical protein
MKKNIIRGAILAALLSTTALADTSSMNGSVAGMGILENDYVKAGVNGTSGTFGSGGGTRPGLQYDSTGTGTFPGDSEQGDYLTPGSPFDGFAISIDGTNSKNNNSGSNAWTDADGLTDGDGTLTWTGTNSAHSGWEIENTYSLGTTSEYIDITTGITVGSDTTDLYFGRYIDPDAMPEAGDTSATDNVLGYGVIPDSNVAFSEATVSRYALGLYSTDSNVDAGISSSWSTSADAYTGSPYTDSDGNSVNYGTGDHTIGLSWHWTSVSVGDILTASYAYIFGPSAFDAADTAITDGAGGGDTTTTDSWGTLEDVGSATDAASGASEPVITYSDPVVDTDLPVLTQSQTTHDASETATVQTIDRETTTIVTTPMEIITYTDDVETARTPTDSVAVTTVTDPGSFTGRVDQLATAQDVVGSTLRNLEFDAIEGIRMTSDAKNGMSGNTSGVVVGGSKELDNGVTIMGGFTRLGTGLTGNDDSVDADTTVLATGVENNGVRLELRRANTDYTVSRTIGDFANTSTTSGTDTSARVMYSPETSKVNPVIGYTRGKRTMDGYAEAGSVQSARTIDSTSEMYGYGTVGLRGDLGLVDFTAMHHTDGANDISLGLEKDTGKVTWRVEGTRSITDLGDTNSFSAGLRIKF